MSKGKTDKFDDVIDEGEQIAAAIESAVEVDQAQAEPEQSAQEQAPALNDPDQVAGVLVMLRESLRPGFGPMFGRLFAVYHDEALKTLSAQACAVGDKYGVSLLGGLGKWALELSLAGSVVSLALASVTAYKMDLVDLKQQAANDQEIKSADV